MLKVFITSIMKNMKTRVLRFQLVLVLLAEIIICDLCGGTITKNKNKRFLCYYAEDQCPNVDVDFWLYTKETAKNPVLLDILNLKPELFPERLPLKILIHGLGLNHNLSPSQEIRPLLLQHEQVYVISVDYSNLSAVLCLYPWAIRNTRLVANCLALLINKLVNQGFYTPQDIHLIGFSLGGQIAGLTANHLNFKIKRITGLDPAGPTFYTNNLTERLDSSDAEFVDVIHTDPRFFSLSQIMGHADFYPNYMHLVQPGCNPAQEYRNCNHFRANIYYAESILTQKGFWSYNCGNYTEYLYNQCDSYSSSPHVEMGFYVDESARGSYFLETHSRPPYAKGPMVQFELEVTNKVK